MAYYNRFNAQETEKAKWNMDDEILKIIRELKISFLNSMKNWELEEAFWILDLICVECDAKLKSKEQEYIENELSELEKLREEYSKDAREVSGKLYIKLRKLYKEINRLMKKHGVWFREFEDDEDET